MWYLDFILGDIKLPSDEDLMKIQRIKETHPEKFKKWADRDITCKQVEDVYFEVEPNKGKTICKALKKCCKSLPDSFTFKDLADHAATLGICIDHCTDDCSSFDNYVSFSLERVVGEDIDKHHLYRKVTSVRLTIVMSRRINYSIMEICSILKWCFFRWLGLFMSMPIRPVTIMLCLSLR